MAMMTGDTSDRIPPIVAVAVANPENAASPQLAVNLVVDTGADLTVLDTALITLLDLRMTGRIPVTTAAGQMEMAQYLADLTVKLGSASVAIGKIGVLASTRLGHGQVPIGGFLGRDVLANALLAYNGQQGRHTLAF
jgi:hypothetical protein